MKINQKFFYIYVIIFFEIISSCVAQTAKQQIDAMKRRWDTPAWTDTIKNPYANNVALTDTGRVIYQKICSVCHGPKGKGDGVAAVGLTVKPADHTSPMVQEQADGSLWWELSNGHAPMPAYKTILSDKQRWALINYIRTLKVKPKATK